MTSGIWRVQELESVFPASRTGHSAVLIAGSKMVIFGGYGQLIPREGGYEHGEGGSTRQYGNTNDMCIVDLEDFKAEWLQPAPNLNARNRVGHSAVSIEGDMYVFGGWSNKREKYLNYGFLFDLKFQQMMTESSQDRQAPAGRRDHSLTLVGTKMYLYGGWDSVRSFNDLWSCGYRDGWSWQLCKPIGNVPGQRRGHSATAVGRRLYIFGGIYGYTRYFNDFYCLDTKTMEFSIPEHTGSPPSPRAWHTASRVPDTGLIIIIGGTSGKERFSNDVHIYDTVRRHWSTLPVTGSPPPPLCSHTAVARGDEIFVFGGLNWHTGNQLKPSSSLHVLKIDKNIHKDSTDGVGGRKEEDDDFTGSDSDEKEKESKSAKNTKGPPKLRDWLTIRHLRKGTVKRSWFSLVDEDYLRQLDLSLLAEARLDTPNLDVSHGSSDPTLRLEKPLVLLMTQTNKSHRVKHIVSTMQQMHNGEYPECYLAMQNLMEFDVKSEEFIKEAKDIANKYLRPGGESELSGVERRSRVKVCKALENGNLTNKELERVTKRALDIIDESLMNKKYFQKILERKLQQEDINQRQCAQCRVKFKDLKLQQVLCHYCLGVFCGDCHGNAEATLPSEYCTTNPSPVCKVCKLILTESFHPIKLTGYHMQRTGLFEEHKGKKSRAPVPRAPLSLVLGLDSETERDAWIEAIRSAAVKSSPEGTETKDASAGKLHKKGWVACRPVWFGKGQPVVWTYKYAVLVGNTFRLFDVHFKEALQLTNWDVHSYNTIAPTLVGEEARADPLGATASGCAYQFSVSNRNSLFKLGSDSSQVRSTWIRALQGMAYKDSIPS